MKAIRYSLMVVCVSLVALQAADVPPLFSPSFIPPATVEAPRDLQFRYSAPDLPRTTLSHDPTVLLPPITVHGDRLPIVKLRPLEVLTPRGVVEFATKQYTSEFYRGTFGPLSQIATYYFNFLSILGGWQPNKAEAMSLHYDAERSRLIREVDDLVQLQRIGDPKQAEQLRDVQYRMREIETRPYRLRFR